jgi:hypothetical protein
MTTEIYLNPEEIAFMLPVLEKVLNGVATERARKHYAGVVSPFARPVYNQRLFDEEIFQIILSCRNKLKQIGHSRKLRLNCFELAALALALRVNLKEKSLPQELRLAHCIACLSRKLESLRKRGKRSWIRKHGTDSFRDASLRWKRFVAWLRFEILAPHQRRLMPVKGPDLLAREQREYMRSLARSIANAGADTKQMQHLADLARLEVRRGRHPFTMRELLADMLKAEQFLVVFILKRKGPGVFKTEYLPKVLRAARLSKDFNATLTSTTPDRKLQAALAKWIEREVDPGYFDDVRKDIGYQLGFVDLHYIGVKAKGMSAVIQACRPEYDANTDRCSFYAVWATRWLLTLQPNKDLVRMVIGPAFRAAKERSEKLNPLARQRKLKHIDARYNSEPDTRSRRVRPFPA